MGSEENINNYIKVALYGDSLSMARENIVENEERYFYLLLNELKKRNPSSLIETIQRSKASITSSEINSHTIHDSVYYNWKGGVAIVHIGIVDCSPRPVNNETREKISKLPSIFKKTIIKYLHNNRRKILLKGYANYVTPIGEFKRNYLEILKNTSSIFETVIVINIAPTNSNIEYRSPGLSKSIQEYNKVIYECVLELSSSNIKLIDIHNYIEHSKKDKDLYVVKEDGHHITALTHYCIFEKIKEVIF